MQNMEKLTFRQYLESKEQLLNAINNVPTSVVEYEVKKYCSLPVGETEDEKQVIGLKPRHKLVVEWRYDNPSQPSPEAIRAIGPHDINEDDKFATFWSGVKLAKWLSRHAQRGENNGHKTN